MLKRHRSEYSGATFQLSHLACPQCTFETQVLQSPITKKVIGIECTSCDWKAYPDTDTKKEIFDQINTLQDDLFESFPQTEGD